MKKQLTESEIKSMLKSAFWDRKVDEEISSTDISDEELINILAIEENIDDILTEHAGEVLEVEPENAQVMNNQSQTNSGTSVPDIGDLIAKGIDFLTQLSETLKPAESKVTGEKSNNSGFIKRDEVTGEKYIKIPITDDKLVAKLTQGLGTFLEVLKR